MNEIAATPAQPAQHLGTILVVDDNELNRDMLSRRLTKSGFTVGVAEDGLLALEWLQANPCDLILLDIMMPRMSGIEVLETVRLTRGAASGGALLHGRA